MKITEETILLIEKALNIKLYENQKQYILYDSTYCYGGRLSGKTLAYCIKLALSDGKPLDVRYKEVINIIDNDYGPTENKRNYSYWFRRFFLDVWHSLKDSGLPVRELIDEID